MKKIRYIIAAIFVVAIGTVVFFACEKEENEKINNNTIKQKTLNIDFSAISVENGMLCFNSWEHYQTVLEALADACTEYANSYFTDLENELGNVTTVSIEILNDTAEARGFSQFAPLHAFCDSFAFNSLYEVLEAEELQWMDIENADIETNPFYNTYFDRYQSALHNMDGDVKIAGEIFNPSDAIRKDPCILKGYVPYTGYFIYNGNQKQLACKLSGADFQCHATTTFYKTKSNGKRKLFFDELYTGISGYVGYDCYGYSLYQITPKGRTNKYVCYQAVYSWHGLLPAYLVNKLYSEHSAVDANVTYGLQL